MWPKKPSLKDKCHPLRCLSKKINCVYSGEEKIKVLGPAISSKYVVVSIFPSSVRFYEVATAPALEEWVGRIIKPEEERRELF